MTVRAGATAVQAADMAAGTTPAARIAAVAARPGVPAVAVTLAVATGVPAAVVTPVARGVPVAVVTLAVTGVPAVAVTPVARGVPVVAVTLVARGVPAVAVTLAVTGVPAVAVTPVAGTDVRKVGAQGALEPALKDVRKIAVMDVRMAAHQPVGTPAGAASVRAATVRLPTGAAVSPVGTGRRGAKPVVAVGPANCVETGPPSGAARM